MIDLLKVLVVCIAGLWALVALGSSSPSVMIESKLSSNIELTEYNNLKTFKCDVYKTEFGCHSKLRGFGTWDNFLSKTTGVEDPNVVKIEYVDKELVLYYTF